MIVEIGTSCFDTRAGLQFGIYIEPVKQYYNMLPDCIKENVAISNFEGEIELYYVSLEDIKKYKLPRWIQGCGSVCQIHRQVKEQILKRGLDLSIVKKDVVKVVRIKSIIEKYKVENIDILKIDTEGHDAVILNDFLDTVDITPTIIKFEHKHLEDNDKSRLITRLKNLGYCINIKKNDVFCKLAS